MVIISALRIKKYYGNKPNMVCALDNVDIQVKAGEFVAVVGKSGSGKSTLLHILGGLDRATSGKVIINGNELNKMTDEELSAFRRRSIGFIFQNFNLIPILNVYENIVLPIELDGKSADETYVDKVLKILAIEDKKDAMPNQLSGGQQQRVAIARALVAKPAILLADEPTGSLDSKTRLDVLKLLKVMSTRLGQTIVMITHDEQVAELADRRIRMEDGRIKKDGEMV